MKQYYKNWDGVDVEQLEAEMDEEDRLDMERREQKKIEQMDMQQRQD